MRQFTIEFSDLKDEKQTELQDEIAKSLLDGWYREAEEHKAEYPEGTSWEEIVCRRYDFDFRYWEDEPVGKNSYDWKSAIIEFAEDQAQEKCEEAIHDIDIIIE